MKLLTALQIITAMATTTSTLAADTISLPYLRVELSQRWQKQARPLQIVPAGKEATVGIVTEGESWHDFDTLVQKYRVALRPKGIPQVKDQLSVVVVSTELAIEESLDEVLEPHIEPIQIVNFDLNQPLNNVYNLSKMETDTNLAVELVDTKELHQFYTEKKGFEFQSPVNNPEDRWEYDSDTCDSNMYACPLEYEVDFPQGMNLTSLKKLFEHEFTTPIRVDAKRARQIISGRMKREGDAWAKLLSHLESESELVYCDDDTYWAPSVNSATCYYVDLDGKKVTRLEHGDVDG